MNRKQAPPLGTFQHLNVQPPTHFTLDNNIPVYVFQRAHPEVLMLKLVFKAGRWYEPAKLVAPFTSRLMSEETASYSAQALADKVEYYGATLKTRANNDFSHVTMHSLSKYFYQLLPIIKEVLVAATFSERELSLLIKNSKQKWLLQQQQNEYLADTLFNELIFGSSHPYGYRVIESDYERMERSMLQSFYQSHYVANNCVAIYLAGDVKEVHFQQLNQYIGGMDWMGNHKLSEQTHPLAPLEQTTHFTSKQEAVQSAIRIGGRIINKTHPDYAACFVLNALLGGYFGSRLMQNLREDKGYTYGIYSSVISMIHSGYWFISAEVAKETCEQAIQEIFIEIERLKSELVSLDELQLVRNYLLGNLLSIIDGPFNLASTLQAIYLYKLDHSFFQQLTETIKTITPQQIQQTAQKYLNTNELVQVVVG